MKRHPAGTIFEIALVKDQRAYVQQVGREKMGGEWFRVIAGPAAERLGAAQLRAAAARPAGDEAWPALVFLDYAVSKRDSRVRVHGPAEVPERYRAGTVPMAARRPARKGGGPRWEIRSPDGTVRYTEEPTPAELAYPDGWALTLDEYVATLVGDPLRADTAPAAASGPARDLEVRFPSEAAADRFGAQVRARGAEYVVTAPLPTVRGVTFPIAGAHEAFAVSEELESLAAGLGGMVDSAGTSFGQPAG